MFVHCTKCHAELAVDRERCPHCGTPVVSEEAKRNALMAENLRLNQELQAATVDLEQKNAALRAKLAAARVDAPMVESA